MRSSRIAGCYVWQAWLDKLFPFQHTQGDKKQRPRGFRPRLDTLESRVAPAVFNVPSGPDPGTNIASISGAILLADGNSDTSNIINVAPGTYSVDNQAIVAPSNKSLMILGQDQGVTITANQSGRVFTIDANVDFEDLTITGGKVKSQSSSIAAQGGGLLIDGGQVTLSNVNVTGNSAYGADGSKSAGPQVGYDVASGGNGGLAKGGGIYLTAGSLTLLSSSVTNNKAVGGNGGSGANATGYTHLGGQGGRGGEADGGAIYVAQGIVAILNSTINANKALGGKGGEGGEGFGKTVGYPRGGLGGEGGSAEGGGCYLGAGTVTFFGSQVDSNFAQAGEGGKGDDALYYAFSLIGYYGSGTANNPGGDGGPGKGGGFYVAGGILSLVESKIDSNEVLGGNGIPSTLVGLGGGDGQGGGIWQSGGSVHIYGGTISSNIAQGGNGGNGPDLPILKEPSFNQLFPGQVRSGGCGGTADGGGIYLSAGSSVLLQASVCNNRATGGAGADGGACSNGPDITTNFEVLWIYNLYGGWGGTSGDARGGGCFVNGLRGQILLGSRPSDGPMVTP